jgi:hypothetical protein
LCTFQETALLDADAATIVQHDRIARNLVKHLDECLRMGLIRMSGSSGSSSCMGG